MTEEREALEMRLMALGFGEEGSWVRFENIESPFPLTGV